MYSRWTSSHVRRLFCFYSSTLSSGGAVVSTAPTKQELHQLSNIEDLLILLVHLRQVHPLKAPSAVRYNNFITYESKA